MPRRKFQPTLPLSDQLLLDPDDAASLIGLTPKFLARRRRLGGGPAWVQLGSNCIRYRPKDLQDWAEANRRTEAAS